MTPPAPRGFPGSERACFGNPSPHENKTPQLVPRSFLEHYLHAQAQDRRCTDALFTDDRW